MPAHAALDRSHTPFVGRRLRLAALVLGAAMLMGACTNDDAAPLAGVVREPALEVGAVELLDVTSEPAQPVAMQAADDGLLVVYFGYTSCPDICPTTMSDISVALADLDEDQADRVRVAMVSVDPERDAPATLSAYLGHFFDTPLALHGSDDASLKAAADAFGVRFEVEAHDPGALTYEVSHSAVTYVVDDTGTVVVEWPFGFDSEQMTSDLAQLLES